MLDISTREDLIDAAANADLNVAKVSASLAADLIESGEKYVQDEPQRTEVNFDGFNQYARATARAKFLNLAAGAARTSLSKGDETDEAFWSRVGPHLHREHRVMSRSDTFAGHVNDQRRSQAAEVSYILDDLAHLWEKQD